MWKPHHRQITYTWARRIAVAVVGGSVLLFGIALIVLPGPAFVFIPIGLTILSLEFAWARRWLKAARERSAKLMGLASTAASNVLWWEHSMSHETPQQSGGTGFVPKGPDEGS